MSRIPEEIKNRRISSILKTGNGATEGETTETFNRVTKRISFSAMNNMKEFQVGESTATIWGQSLEVVAKSSDQDTENISQPPANTISMFADAERDDEISDVEMVDINPQRQSVMQRKPLTDVNQTMFMNQTCEITDINQTMYRSVTNLENVPVVSANKRKSVVNITVQSSVRQSPIEKCRKMGESQMDLTLLPDTNFSETTMDVDDSDNCARNLNETHIWNDDLATSDDFSSQFLNITNQRIHLFHDDSYSHIPSNKTSTTVTEIVTDDQSIHQITHQIPYIDKSKNSNETCIFGHDDAYTGIDETVVTRNLLEDKNFSQFLTVNHQLSSHSADGNTIDIENNESKAKDVQNSCAAGFSILNDTPDPAINEIQSSINKFEATGDIMNDRDHCPEHSLILDKEEPSLTMKSILTTDYFVSPRRMHGPNSLQAEELQPSDKEQRSQSLLHTKAGSILIGNELVIVAKPCMPDSLEELKHISDKERSPSFHHVKSGSTLIGNEAKPYVPHSLEVKHSSDGKYSPSYHHMKSGSTLIGSEAKFGVPDSLEALKHSDDKERSPSFHHVKSGSTLIGNEAKPYVPHSLEVKHSSDGKRSPSYHHIQSGSTLIDSEAKFGVPDSLEALKHSNDKERSPSFHHVKSGITLTDKEFVIESKYYVPNSIDVLKKRCSDDRLECTKLKKVSKSLLPSLNQTSQKDDRANTSSVSSSQVISNPGFIDNLQKFSSTKYFDTSINSSDDGNQFLAICDLTFANCDPPSSNKVFAKKNLTPNVTSDGNQFLAICDLTFANCDPLSSTKFFAKKSLTPNMTSEMKPTQSSLTFNSSSPILKKSRLGASHNNTDDLCNLEPEELRKIDMKKMFLDITNDMLSETKQQLVDESVEVSTNHTTNADIVRIDNNIQCQKCGNCRKGIDGNMSFLKIEDMKELELDFSGYEQFKGLATYKDVIEAREKRKKAKELAKRSLIDQNVPRPGWDILWENKKATMTLPQPECEQMLLTCFPMRMSIEFLLKNKMRTEYTKWKYFDNYFFIGGIALRHEKIPSIRIHIKFDRNGPERAETLSIPLAFKRVFVEECPYYLKNISARNYLKHKHGLAMLPLDLTTMCSDTQNIYKALDQFDEWFESVAANISELVQLTIEGEAFLIIHERQCYIEKTIFDTKKYFIQNFVIKLDKIDKVGPSSVHFSPVNCETTDEFNNLPLGLSFLRAFLKSPKSFLKRFIDG